MRNLFSTAKLTNTVSDHKVLNVEFDLTEVNELVNMLVSQYMASANPLKFQSQFSSVEECQRQFARYRKTLFNYRVKQIIHNGKLNCKSQLQACYMLPYDIAIFANIGRYIDDERGLIIQPKGELTFEDGEMMSLEELSTFSFKLGMWKNEGLSLNQNAFPKEYITTSSAMQFILLDNYIRGMITTDDVTIGFMSAFIGTKLVEEAESNLFMVRYNPLGDVYQKVLATGDTLFSRSSQGGGQDDVHN